MAVPEATVNINVIPHASAAVIYAGQLRVYITDSLQIVEQVFDGRGWGPGAFTAPGHHVVATSWSTTFGSISR